MILDMEIKIYTSLPDEAMQIRTTVFVKEQGFVDLPDETDLVALHFVGYIGTLPVTTCRAFADSDGDYILGRFAVLKAYRGKGLGSELLGAVCDSLRERGISCLKLHSQYLAKDFYEKNGFEVCGEPEYEQNALHVWMKKML